LIIGVLFGSTVGFLQDGVSNVNQGGSFSGSLNDYFVKPIYWILYLGFIPMVISGSILGFQIKRRA
jgi:hypothetical protein